MEGSVCGLIEVLFQHLTGTMKKTYETRSAKLAGVLVETRPQIPPNTN